MGSDVEDESKDVTINLGDVKLDQLVKIKVAQGCELVVYIPLPNIDIINSYRDITEDSGMLLLSLNY